MTACRIPEIARIPSHNCLLLHNLPLNPLQPAYAAAGSCYTSGGPTPFAADYSAPGGTAYPKDFVLLAKREREPTGKVGNMEAWDNEVYTSQRATNAAIHEQTRLKKFGQPGMDASHGAPFATSDAFDDLRRRDYYHAKPKKDRTGAGKVNA